MAWHKPGTEFADGGIFFDKRTCLVCGASQLKRKKARRWGSWYRKGVGNVTGQCPGPPEVIEAIIAPKRQRPGLTIDEGGKQ